MVIQLTPYSSLIGDIMAQSFLNGFSKSYDTAMKEHQLQNSLNFIYPSMYQPSQQTIPLSSMLQPLDNKQSPLAGALQPMSGGNQTKPISSALQPINPPTPGILQSLSPSGSQSGKLKDFDTWLNEFMQANHKQLSTLMGMGYNPLPFITPAIQNYELAYRTNFAKQQEKEKENFTMQLEQNKQNQQMATLKTKYEAAIPVIKAMAKKFGVNLDPNTIAYAALGMAYGVYKLNDLANIFKNHYTFQPRTSPDGTIYYVSEDPRTGTIKNVYSFKPNISQLSQIASAKSFAAQHAKDEAKKKDGVGSGRGGDKNEWELKEVTYPNPLDPSLPPIKQTFWYNKRTGQLKRFDPSALNPPPPPAGQNNPGGSSDKGWPHNLLKLIGGLKGNN